MSDGDQASMSNVDVEAEYDDSATSIFRGRSRWFWGLFALFGLGAVGQGILVALAAPALGVGYLVGGLLGAWIWSWLLVKIGGFLRARL